jgi:hypothetical protein
MKADFKRSEVIFMIVVLLTSLAGLGWWYCREIEVSRTVGPSGRHVAVVSYHRWQKPFSALPGQSSDHAGFIRIETLEGRSLGKGELPILWMDGDLRWEEHGARLVGTGVWDFRTGTFEVWR